MIILYPSDYFDRSKPDAEFQAEAAAFVASGGHRVAVNTDELLPVPKLAIPADATVMYRGWMLDTTAYGQLVDAIEASGARPFTDLESYLRTHHIPNWCEILKDLSPQTVVLPLGSNYETELRTLGWDAFFVKDYVKSLKTSVGSVVRDPAQIGQLLEEWRSIVVLEFEHQCLDSCLWELSRKDTSLGCMDDSDLGA